MNARNRNELWARALLDELARSGVRNIVVAPGSRSTPLVLAAADDARFRTAVQVDERSAGFLALGVGKGTGVPAAVITTSGTAVANLLPAVVEAFQAEVPLLLLTADRPPRLRGADANQAIEQPHIFGRYTRLFQELAPTEVSDRALRHLRATACRAVAAAIGDPSGPVHLNLAFEKPLEPVPVPGDLPEGLADSFRLAVKGRPDGAPFTRIHPRRLLPPDAVLEALALRLAAARRPLLVAGPAARPLESGPGIRALARALAIPLLADPLSGARGRDAGCGYDLALRIPEARARLVPDLVLRFGTTPSSASLAAWLAELGGPGQAPEVTQLVVDGGDRWKDHLAVASEVVPGDPARVAEWLLARFAVTGSVTGPGSEPGSEPGTEPGTDPAGDATGADAGWAGRWSRLDGVVAGAVAAGLGSDFFEGAAAVMAADHAAAEPAGILFVSNSMPVRDVDSLWPLGSPGGEGVTAETPPSAPGVEGSPPPLRIVGNRGASGIDGIVSTALGVAWGTGERVTALIGDLALVHDMNGLLRARDLDLPDGGESGGGAPGGVDDGAHCKVDFVVVNNDGGGIFHMLPVRDFEPHFTRFVATPHGLEPERIAALHGLPFRSVEGRRAHATGPGPLDAVQEGLSWAREQPGSTLLEIRTDRNENRERHDEVLERIRAALVSSPDFKPEPTSDAS